VRPASQAPTVASEDSFADVIEATSDAGRSITDVAVLAPNALNLTEVQLVCIHREFEKIGRDAQRLGRTDDRMRPVVTLKEGESTYYFVKTPDGAVFQVVPARRESEQSFEQRRRYETVASYLEENPSASAAGNMPVQDSEQYVTVATEDDHPEEW